jgi:hypothetical protein
MLVPSMIFLAVAALIGFAAIAIYNRRPAMVDFDTG